MWDKSQKEKMCKMFPIITVQSSVNVVYLVGIAKQM